MISIFFVGQFSSLLKAVLVLAKSKRLLCFQVTHVLPVQLVEMQLVNNYYILFLIKK
jgi:hypothetical protein